MLWVTALEGIDDSRGDYLERHEQRVRTLERAVEGLLHEKEALVNANHQN